MIVAVPFPIEVTKPAAETVAIEALDELHVTAAPDIVVPPASLTVATSVAVSANDANERLVGASVTELDTWDTVAVAVLLTEPDVAVIVAVPFATEVTSPADDTVAISVSD